MQSKFNIIKKKIRSLDNEALHSEGHRISI
jgi:hypothetical protein